MNNYAEGPEEDEEDDEKKVYVTLSLSKYPFLRNIKVGEKGEASFKGEIEKAENRDDSVHHVVVFHDLKNLNAGRRV